MSVKSGANDYRAGDTKPDAPDTGDISIYVKSTVPAAPTVANSLPYMQDSLGNESVLFGYPSTYIKRGKAAMVAGQLVVNFVALGLANEPDTNYTPNGMSWADEALHIVSIATTGFTLASGDSSSTADVSWSTVRMV